ncbi:M23 family peptidase, partial [Treponema pallidum]
VPAPERREISLRDPRQYISKKVDKNARWPVSPTSLAYVRGKTYGVVIDSERNAAVRALMSGKVISRGTHRGYGQVLFV